MSTTTSPGKNSPDTTREDAPPDIDTYAVDIPDAFIEGFAGETVAEKLRNAEAAPAHDADAIDWAECPRCGSRRLSPKGGGSQGHKKTDGYVCEGCRTHVSDPEHPAQADIVFSDGQVQLGRFGDE